MKFIGIGKRTPKTYPFSTQKHAHDIEFRKNRVFCEMHDMEVGTTKMDWELYNKLYELKDKLDDLLEAVCNSRDGRICYLTGPQIGLAKETVLWASETRANTQMSKRG